MRARFLRMRPVLGAAVGVVATAVLLGICSRMESPSNLLIFVGLVPWFAVLDRLASLRAAALSGLLLSLLFTPIVFTWFGKAMADYSGNPLAVGMALLLLTAPLAQHQYLFFAMARHVARRRLDPLPAAVAGAFAWVGIEWFFPKLFTDTLGHGFFPSPWLRQAADIAGAPGLTFLIVLCNEMALVAATRMRARASLRAVAAPLLGILAIAGALAGYGAWRLGELAAHEARGPVLRAGLVQANLAGYENLREEMGTYDAVRFILDTYYAGSREALTEGRLDLLVWPETIYPTTFGRPKSEDGAELDADIVRFVRDTGVPLIFGSYDRDEAGEYNAAFFVPADGPEGDIGIYRKTALFPLTEYVPWWMDWPWVREALPWLGTWTKGHGAEVVELPLVGGRRLRTAPLICFDAIDPSLALQGAAEGAEAIVTISNDAWFAGDGDGAHLHLMVSAFRSIETRLPQLRATTTGVSALVGADGELVSIADVGERKAMVVSFVPGGTMDSLMRHWGDWFGPVAFAAALAMLVALPKLGPRRAPLPPSPSTPKPGSTAPRDRASRRPTFPT